jgi:predicted MFS family arabinose efflux permease
VCPFLVEYGVDRNIAWFRGNRRAVEPTGPAKTAQVEAGWRSIAQTAGGGGASRIPPKRFQPHPRTIPTVARRDCDDLDSLRSWLVVGASFLTLLVTWGTLFSFGVLLDPLAREFDTSRVAISTVFSAETFAVYIVAGLMGILLTRVRIRRVIATVAVWIALLSGTLHAVSSYLGLLVVFAGLGLAMGIMYVVVVSVTPRWFDEHRGIATGIFFAGNGLGMQVMPPVWSWLIDTQGVRSAFTIVLLAAAAIYALTAVVLRRPRVAAHTDERDVSELLAWLARLIRQRPFLLLFLAMALMYGWYFLLATHAVNMFSAWGMDRGFATVLFGAIGGSSIFARVASGYAGQRLGYRRTIAAALALVAVGFVVLLGKTRPLIYLAVVLSGIGLGTITAIYVPMLLDIFDPTNDTAIVGIFSVSFGVAALVVPPASTLVVESTGSYELVLVATAMITGLNVAIFYRSSDPTRWPDSL